MKHTVFNFESSAQIRFEIMPATAATPVKAKKVAKKPATKPDHPTYKVMVVAAVSALKCRKGTSREAITKYIKANYNVNDSCDLFVMSTVVKGVASGVLVQVSGWGLFGFYKLAKEKRNLVFVFDLLQ